MKTEKLTLDLADWKEVEKNAEQTLRKQLIDIEITRGIRKQAKKNIIKLHGKTSEQEKKDLLPLKAEISKELSSKNKKN